ncbi:toll/interleukin-1 receptor domain-containing protein [Leifsonia shinshuensis]|uniref:toll/interleukin-1 receptor domain-containing protein n=1 Tax=Leifsonia shinshuensis TaxID=150026 RepID=UPI001F510E88|nr:toll/interleukin-1 receptor domain-containing protein [Leifsonia shinshuensis]MCI0157089.1 toll/interleukin-1 receptor domain-containing protein [Leifsonia shinshuensis]
MPLSIPERHAFLSYMHENTEEVNELQDALESAGIRVWRDTEDLWPGDDWEAKIRSAIKSDSLAFIACFSSVAESRAHSYQYEELTVAVEEYRQRRPNSSWLFTVRFDNCAIPAFDLGGGRRLDTTIQRVDLFGPGKLRQIERLVRAVQAVMRPPAVGIASTPAASATSEKVTFEGSATPPEQFRPVPRIALDQRSLSAMLTERMNSTMTSWVIFGPFEIDHVVRRLLTEVPQLARSTADDDGFAQSPDGDYRWICVDAEMGSAVFLFPRTAESAEKIRDELSAIDGGLQTTVGIFGNVDDRVWITLGGAGQRKVIPAQDFLPADRAPLETGRQDAS